MKKKIKIIVIVSLVLIGLTASILAAMAINTTSYAMNINSPSRIIVYYDSPANNKVYEPSSKEYSEIYSSITNGLKQRILPAFFAGELSKNVKVCSNPASNVKLNNIAVALIYDTPQVLRCKKNLYTDSNGRNYWYQSLIFNVSSADNYQYHSIAIIPPEDSPEYVSNFHYTMHYQVYGNFSDLNQYALQLFN